MRSRLRKPPSGSSLSRLFFPKIAFTDYLYKCSIPVFEGLLPDKHNSTLMDLLFIMAHWHTLAKLRQHTDLSLNILESVTVQLGESLRNFQEKTCSAFDTKALKREKATGERQAGATSSTQTRKGKSVKKSGKTAERTGTATATSKPSTSKGRIFFFLNLNTYKDHSLGDYVETIRQYGTTDSYSTESVGSSLFFQPLKFAQITLDGTRAPLFKIAVS